MPPVCFSSGYGAVLPFCLSARAEGREGPEAVELSLCPPVLGGLSSFLELAGREETFADLTRGSSVYSFEMVLVPHRSGPVLRWPFCD